MACFQRDKPTVVAHTLNPSTWEADIGELPRVPGQLHTKFLDYIISSMPPWTSFVSKQNKTKMR